MNRRYFLELTTLSSGLVMSSAAWNQSLARAAESLSQSASLKADLIIAGGGLGGVATALAALRNGLRVVLTEETDWLGGQITQQGVPPDEHQWIETHGAPPSYRSFREGVRAYYRQHYPLTAEAKARPYLNPGDGAVSRLCHEPKVAVAVLMEMLAPYVSNRQLLILLEYKVIKADTQGDRVQALHALHLPTKRTVVLEGAYFVDATELGDVLPLTKTEYVTGSEANSVTNELHAGSKANPINNQSFTMCLAMDYVPGEDHTIAKPKTYDFWRTYVPNLSPAWSGRMLSLSYSNPRTLAPKSLGFHPEGIPTGNDLNLWNYRRIINRQNFTTGTYVGDITIMNWPQNDYVLGNIVDVSEKEFSKHVEQAKQQSLSLFYWLQTEAPRPDGGLGWRGLRLRGDVLGTHDGLAKYPYVRESRRVKALFTVLEEHVGADNRARITGKPEGNTAAVFPDSVGIGYYHIDLHPSSGGDNYIDFASLPFQIPLGALLPQRMENLLPACKNIGTTHLTNGCYRLHPVEWSIGEAVGLLIKQSLDRKLIPRAIYENKNELSDFQAMIRRQGIETEWPR